ncbi:MAG: aldehyde dehydrogenase family protein [Ignavibacteriaceae bacterium]
MDGLSIQSIMENAVTAAAIFSQLDQEHTDRIVKAVYTAGFNNRVRLARMAIDETKMGVFEDKVIKNVLATQLVYEDIKNIKTVGVISEDFESGIVEIAQPLGPIFAITPVTNPTSTVMFKILIALKSRNPIIIRPHSNAVNCSIEAARICYEAALSEDAPENCIQWIPGSTREETHQLMAHKDMALILATGGGGLVNAAYSSGTPALGVGAGNVPVYIEKSADIKYAVSSIMSSKLFDNGTVCASEQAIVVEKGLSGEVKNEFVAQGGYFMNEEEIEKVSAVVFDSKKKVMSSDIMGKSVSFIADLAGIKIPETARLLIAELKGVGEGYPLSHEILAPVIAFYEAADYDSAVNLCIDLNYHGGVGHTASIFSNDEAKIRHFSMLMNAGRIVVNMPSSQGAVGCILNTLPASLTLGCGTGGKNITTDNVTARNLLNIQRITRRRVNRRFENFDKSLYFDESVTADKVDKIYDKNF